MNNATQTSVTDDQLDDELEALIGNATGTTVTANAANDDEHGNKTVNDAEIDLEQIEALATAAEIRNTAYAEQEGEPAANDDGSSSATAKTPRVPRTSRPSRAAGATASSILTSVIPAADLLKAACLVEGDVESEEAADELKTTINSLAKKVGDKAVNLLRFKNEPKRLQTYTRLGLQFLVKNGTATSKELTDFLQANKYTVGTARSQANQLMALLPALKVAEKSGRTLTVNTASTIVKDFEAAMTA